MGKISEKTAANRIAEKTGGQMIYLSGYQPVVKNAVLHVRCSVCGADNLMTYHNLTAQYRGCPACMRANREEKKLKKIEERERKNKAREEKAKERELWQTIRETPHLCPVCGLETTRRKYCSDKCANNAMNKRGEIRRRKKLQNAMVDKDITVKGLFKRDEGKCYLCGKRCNFDDYIMRGNIFIAGDWYPSIDHVVPLAKGGDHSWENVRLAHRRCNSNKRDYLIGI